jgi:hypothetical protein
VALTVSLIAAFTISASASAQDKRASSAKELAAKVVARAPARLKQEPPERDDLSKRLTKEEMEQAMISECIQPDYRAWERVTLGMSVADVRKFAYFGRQD